MKTSIPSSSKSEKSEIDFSTSSSQTQPSLSLSPCTTIAPPPTPVALNGDGMLPDKVGSPNVAPRALSGTCWVERAAVEPSNGSAGASRATCWVERGSGCAHPAKADPSGSGFPLSPVTVQASPCYRGCRAEPDDGCRRPPPGYSIWTLPVSGCNTTLPAWEELEPHAVTYHLCGGPEQDPTGSFTSACKR